MQQSGKDVKRTLGQKTEDCLMKYILDKPVKIGERIPTEGELTELFEVGRSTVRGAVKGLVTRSVLEVRRGDGTYVISTIYMENDVLEFGNVEDRYRLALDLFDVRLMIEPEIVTWACRKATEEQIQKLKQLCDEHASDR
jgi:DNA-binding FadR family transcriptional regulator